jgi:hypothetical protein
VQTATHIDVMYICVVAFWRKMRVSAVSALDALPSSLNHTEPEFGPSPRMPKFEPESLSVADMNTWSLTVYPANSRSAVSMGPDAEPTAYEMLPF